MKSSEEVFYRLNDDISFRECTLSKCWDKFDVGDCTNFRLIDGLDEEIYRCAQYGIHLHCTKHLGIELELIDKNGCQYLKCKKCNKKIKIESGQKIVQECKKLLNIDKFKGAKLIRLDDYYVPELTSKIDLGKSDYWMHVDIKKDKDGDTIIVLYVGKKGTSKKTQIFIKPEKLQLSSDHKDLDPATILSKIEVTLRDRKFEHKYDEPSIN